MRRHHRIVHRYNTTAVSLQCRYITVPLQYRYTLSQVGYQEALTKKLTEVVSSASPDITKVVKFFNIPGANHRNTYLTPI